MDMDGRPTFSGWPVSMSGSFSRCIMSIHWSIWRSTEARIALSPVVL